MKKRIILCLILFAILTLTGCFIDEAEKLSNEKLQDESLENEMSLEPAILTTEERKIFELVSMQGTIYDYNVHQDMKTIRYEVVEYTNGQNPVVLNKGGMDFQSSKGRLYLAHDINNGNLTISIQDENGSHSSTFSEESPPNVNNAPSIGSQMYLTRNQEIKVGEKIPISLVLRSNSDEMNSWNIERYMEELELLKEYSKAYLVTITFEVDRLK